VRRYDARGQEINTGERRLTHMKNRIKSALRLAGMYFRFNMASAMEYRVSFLTTAVSMFFSNATFIFFWWVLFDSAGGDIGGYDFRDVMFIWAASASGFGLVNAVFGNLSHLNEIIMTGQLDTYLLQPRNALLSLMLSRTEFSAWGDMLYGLVLVIITGQGVQGFLAYLLAVVTGGLVLAAFIVILQSSAFFLGDSSFLSGMSVNLAVNFTTYPEGIFPDSIRFLLYWLVPAQFIVHVPLRIARGENALIWLPMQLLATAFFIFIAFRFFKAGLKRYESGNLIVTRL
jgi:ABC-2 type transport system permease protein